MSRAQVADGGTGSNIESLRIYSISCRGQPTRCFPPPMDLGEELTTPNLKKRILLRNIHRQSLGPGLILWYELSNETETRDLVLGRLEAYISQGYLWQQPGNWLNIN